MYQVAVPIEKEIVDEHERCRSDRVPRGQSRLALAKQPVAREHNGREPDDEVMPARNLADNQRGNVGETECYRLS
jgi:hypothetical protein